jgi:predicted nucleic acid-binding Zn ribbon protein
MSTPAEQAKALGLEYGGFGGWINPSTRQVVAKTIDGKLVRTDGSGAGSDRTDLGRLVVMDFDDDLLYARPEDASAVKKYVDLMHGILKTGSDFYILTDRKVEDNPHAQTKNKEQDVAKFLDKVGIKSGVQFAPIVNSEPHKKKLFVQKKIKEGYTEIQYFDRDEKAIHAIDSLKAPYNKLDVRIDGHKLPSFQEVRANVTTERPPANPEQ